MKWFGIVFYGYDKCRQQNEMVNFEIHESTIDVPFCERSPGSNEHVRKGEWRVL